MAVRSVVVLDETSEIRDILSTTHALWVYEPLSPARVLQHRLKYGGHRSLAVHLGRILGQSIRILRSSVKYFDMMVPVPVHPVRLLERGYNQADEIAHGVSDILNIPVERKALVRHFLSESQVQNDRDEREKNLRSAFSMAPGSALAGKNILLIDDVVTTGATIRSAINTLSDAGVSRVGIAVLFAVPLDPV